MNIKEFEDVITNQIGRSSSMLNIKGKEYATEDRLHQFRKASHLRNTSMKDVLAGMMIKHTTSIYDMCNSQNIYSEEVWNEKITDHINYLLLLRAVVEEEEILK